MCHHIMSADRHQQNQNWHQLPPLHRRNTRQLPRIILLQERSFSFLQNNSQRESWPVLSSFNCSGEKINSYGIYLSICVHFSQIVRLYSILLSTKVPKIFIVWQSMIENVSKCSILFFQILLLSCHSIWGSEDTAADLYVFDTMIWEHDLDELMSSSWPAD